MTRKSSFLHSGYIIDGARQILTPADMLKGCCAGGVVPPPDEPSPEVIADEFLDVKPTLTAAADHDTAWYCEAIASLPKRSFPLSFAGEYTCGKIAASLIDAIWMGGHFRLQDLALKADWKWNDGAVGNMAAFYRSVEAASEYIDALGLSITSLSVTRGQCAATFKARLAGAPEVDDELEDEAEPRSGARLSRRRKCPASILPESSDWLVYIPFDPCDHRLGGSAFAETIGQAPGTAPDIGDAGYFSDCFEVVRELVEDGVVKAGATVFSGGLMCALKAMAQASAGAEISVNDVCRAYGETVPVRVLFGEVPGVILQIADIDYDYIDAEFLLQDVAYFPLGHPTPGDSSISLLSDERYGISGILESLLGSREGED